ncbi:MAG: hypothetical protein U1E02_40160, partial [Hydrogenophaga sp.]|nr:hypothetical protein [Hydrogenophaga sp.]
MVVSHFPLNNALQVLHFLCALQDHRQSLIEHPPSAKGVVTEQLTGVWSESKESFVHQWHEVINALGRKFKGLMNRYQIRQRHLQVVGSSWAWQASVCGKHQIDASQLDRGLWTIDNERVAEELCR